MYNALIHYTEPYALNHQNRITLFSSNLIANYKYLLGLNQNISIAPVFKSNAYGHGLIEIANMLDDVGAPFFCVNSFAEAYMLWKSGIKTKIHIMGYVDPESLKHERLPFSYTTYNYEQLEATNRYQPHAEIHVFVDTGMHREGFRVEKLPKLLKNLKQLKNLQIVGLMSHFASGDKPDSDETRNQIRNFNTAEDVLKKFGIQPKWKHIAASSGFLSFAKIEGIDIGNVARVGKAVYGIDPRGPNPNLKPILELTTKIVQIKSLKSGDKVGYDGTYSAPKDIVLGVLPIGYYDGVDRRLSNIGVMLVDGITCPIVGRVSMNITTIDISDVLNPRVGQEVVVFSDKPHDPNSIERTAILCNTIPYDIVAGLADTLSRQIF